MFDSIEDRHQAAERHHRQVRLAIGLLPHVNLPPRVLHPWPTAEGFRTSSINMLGLANAKPTDAVPVSHSHYTLHTGPAQVVHYTRTWELAEPPRHGTVEVVHFAESTFARQGFHMVELADLSTSLHRGNLYDLGRATRAADHARPALVHLLADLCLCTSRFALVSRRGEFKTYLRHALPRTLNEWELRLVTDPDTLVLTP